MKVYESDNDLTAQDVNKFKSWLDDNIGTEYEVNMTDMDELEYQITVFDLTPNEVKKIQAYEVTVIW